MKRDKIRMHKCKKHGQDLFYILERDDGTYTIICQVCFDEKVTSGEIALYNPNKS